MISRPFVKSTFLTILLLGGFFIFTNFASGQISNGTYTLESSVVSAGGSSLSDANYSFDAVLGETFIGRLTDGVYEFFIGFLQSSQTIVYACSDGLDNDGDGLVDLDDNGCENATDDNEFQPSGGCVGCSPPPPPPGDLDPDPEDPSQPSCFITASPATTIAGGSVTISWGGEFLALTGHSITNIGTVVSSGSAVVNPEETTVYQGSFQTSEGSVACQVEVEVLSLNAGQISFVTDSYFFDEDAGTVVVFLERVGGSAGEASVALSAWGAVAQSGLDYVFSPVGVTWEDGDSSAKSVSLEIIEDTLVEGPEVVELSIETITGALLGDNPVAYVQIVDNDIEITDPVLTIIKTVDNKGVGTLGVESFLISVAETPVSSGQNIVLPALTPVLIDGNIPSGYSLSSVTGSPICPSGFGQNIVLNEGAEVICRFNFVYNSLDLDPDPEDPDPDPIDPEPIDPTPDLGGGSRSFVSFVNMRTQANEQDGFVAVQLVREGSLAGELEARLMFISGTAQLGSDYQPNLENIFWADGEGGVKLVNIPLVVDNIPEADESFTVALSSLSNGEIASPNRTIITIKDPVNCLDGQCDEPIEDVSPLPKVLSDFLENTPPVVKNAIESTKKFIDSDSGQVAVVATTVAGVATSVAAAAVTVVANPGLLAEIFTLPIRLWSLLLSVLGVKRRGQPWGVVYDSITKQPLDPAYVVMKADTGEEISTSITDIDGRYGFLVKAGSYRLEVGKTNYRFPSQFLAGKTKDELYDRLYFGDLFSIKEDGEVVLFNIPMDPLRNDWNQQKKASMKITRFYNKHSVAIAILTNVIFYAGVIMAITATLLSPNTFNFIVLGIYALVVLLRIIGIRSKKYGQVINTQTGEPFAFGVVKFISKKSGVEVAKRMTDSMGRYYALISAGVYKIVVEANLPDGTKQVVATVDSVKTKQGIVRKIIRF